MCCLGKFTFHYVSIKSMLRGCRNLHYSYLHSTMYLLNRRRWWLWLVRFQHLHSTMYLLNRLYNSMQLYHMLIYIPLCIY